MDLTATVYLDRSFDIAGVLRRMEDAWDSADSLNYYRGQCYVGLDGLPLDLGNTADLTFTSTIANADIAIIRGGTAL